MWFAIQDHLFSASLVSWAWQTLLFQFVWASVSSLSVQLQTPVRLSVPRYREGLATATIETCKQWPILLWRRGERKHWKGDLCCTVICPEEMSVRAVRPMTYMEVTHIPVWRKEWHCSCVSQETSVWCLIVILICGHVYCFSVNFYWQNPAISMN